ncbi:MAG: ATP/GTP-binding protein [Conexivisphaerales archaeon]
MDVIFIVGTAGSGKSTMASILSKSLKDDGWEVATLNADPFSENLTYEPTVDVRNYIDHNELSRKYGLGINGTMVFSMDLLATMIDEMLNEVGDVDYLIVDTAGQLELFIFRHSGKYLFQRIAGENKALLLVSDIFLVSEISNFTIIQILFSAISSKFNSPVIQVINKIDLDSATAEKVKRWFLKPELIITDLNKNVLSFSRVYKAARLSGLLSPAFFTSAATGNGITELKAEISRIFKGGEDKKA